MGKNLNYLALLQVTIQAKHNCAAAYCESVHVRETQDKQTIWEGDVEVFDLTGNAEANTCYAWSYDETHKGGGVRMITVLGKRPVDSPLMAVRIAIFYDVQPVSVQNIFKK